MCDYSLETYRSRPAQLGERYETHLFRSYSIGFIAPGDPSIAVCMAYELSERRWGPQRNTSCGSHRLGETHRERDGMGRTALKGGDEKLSSARENDFAETRV